MTANVSRHTAPIETSADTNETSRNGRNPIPVTSATAAETNAKNGV